MKDAFEIVKTDEEWDAWLGKPGLKIVDVYAKWAGPCDAISSIFRRLKMDLGEQIFFLQAQTEQIEALLKYRNRSRPTFLFFYGSILVKIVNGANSPAIEKTITEQIELEKTGGLHVPLADISFVADLKRSVAPAEGSQSNLARTSTTDNPLNATAEVDLDSIEHTLAFIKPDAMHPGTIIQIYDILKRNRIDILARKKVWLNRVQAAELYKEHKDADWFEKLISFLTSAPILVFVFAKENVVAIWRDLIGPTSTKRAKDEKPKSIRALFGTDNLSNAVFGSATVENAKKEIDFFFRSEANESGLITELEFSESALESASVTSQKTLVLLKPDICGLNGGGEGASGSSKVVEEIIETILWRGFQIVKREEFLLPTEQATELFSMHSQQPWFGELISFMSSGPCIALVLRGEDVVKGWHEMAGPLDPEDAKLSAPMSIRARFGTSIVQNAVYSSDNIDDAMHDIQVMFPHIVMTREGSMVVSRKDNAQIRGSRSSLVGRNSIVSALPSRQRILERTLCIIKPDAYAETTVEGGSQPVRAGKNEIINSIFDSGFTIIAQKEVTINDATARELNKEFADSPNYEEIVTSYTKGIGYAVVLERDSAINFWKEIIGPTSPEMAKEMAPQSLRAKFGVSDANNGVHGSDSPTSAEKEISLLFGDEVSPFPEGMQRAPSHAHLINHEQEYHTQENSVKAAAVRSSLTKKDDTAENVSISPGALQRTLALIKPDAYGAGKKDEIMNIIRNAGFTVVAEQEAHWSVDKAQAFYKEHEGKPFYEELTNWMSSAPIYTVVLEKEDAVVAWRALAGPTNSNSARETAPQSIRALFGTDGSQNAVHGSDSPDSSKREIEIVFGDYLDHIIAPAQPQAPPTQNQSPNKARRTQSQTSLGSKKPSMQALQRELGTKSQRGSTQALQKSQAATPKRVLSTQALTEATTKSKPATPKRVASSQVLEDIALKSKTMTTKISTASNEAATKRVSSIQALEQPEFKPNPPKGLSKSGSVVSISKRSAAATPKRVDSERGISPEKPASKPSSVHPSRKTSIQSLKAKSESKQSIKE